MSDDGHWSIVVIALLGSPFSPAYARARLGQRAPRALDFTALNVALYGPHGATWALDERAISDGSRASDTLAMGRSSFGWRGDALVVDIDEPLAPALPWRRRLAGRVVLHPEVCSAQEVILDRHGAGPSRSHLWWPVAPTARIEVDISLPSRVRFRGHGYHDANAGSVPLEDTFSRWTWSRARLSDRTLVTYDVSTRETAGTAARAFGFDRSGAMHDALDLVRSTLPTTRWGIRRDVRSDDRGDVSIVRDLEDGPFYARSLVGARLGGERTVMMHETLSADRWRRSWVRFLAGFRISREAA